MRAEIIIACRGEKQENIDITIKSLLGTIGEIDGIHVVFDGMAHRPEVKEGRQVCRGVPWTDAPRGPGACRHYGAEVSNAEYIIFVDAHMTFPKGWLNQTIAHLKKHPKDITCAHMQSLNHQWEPDGNVYAGARLVSHTVEPTGEHWAIAAKWNKTDIGKGKIRACMGACYGMRRDHYINGMGGPLQVLNQWGGDEEILSIATWIAGGSVYLLPYTVGHVYNAPCKRAGQTRVDQVNILANRLSVIEAMPIGDKSAFDYHDWIYRSPQACAMVDETDQEMKERQPQIDAVRSVLNKYKRKFSGLKPQIHRMTDDDNRAEGVRRAGLNKKPPAPPPGDVAQVVVRPVERCERCNARDSFRQIQGMKDRGAFFQAYARCKKCGHQAKIRKF
jgi:glycosyltransferase involved in cell wall biosynthesis